MRLVGFGRVAGRLAWPLPSFRSIIAYARRYFRLIRSDESPAGSFQRRDRLRARFSRRWKKKWQLVTLINAARYQYRFLIVAR